jgi:hypothetical protein
MLAGLPKVQPACLPSTLPSGEGNAEVVTERTIVTPVRTALVRLRLSGYLEECDGLAGGQARAKTGKILSMKNSFTPGWPERQPSRTMIRLKSRSRA